MYEKGLLRIIDPPCNENMDEEHFCDNFNHEHCLIDGRESNYTERLFPCVHLPHSCGKWIIGGPAEIRTMIQDLKDVLFKIRELGYEE